MDQLWVFARDGEHAHLRGREAVLKVLEAADRVLNLGGQFRYLHELEDRDAGHRHR